MAYYLEEEEVYKCAQHPSKRRSSGICPYCLKDRLSALCPDCTSTLPCSCSSTSSASSSSSSSSYFSIQLPDSRMCTLIEAETSFGRSRSSAFPFFRSARFSTKEDEVEGRRSSMSLWGMLWGRKDKAAEGEMMKRSRSLVVAGDEMRMAAPTGKKAWYFPSPMKLFRHSKTSSKVIHERSPFCRG